MSVDERLALAFIASHPLDAARLLDRAEPKQAADILATLPASLAASVYQLLAPPAAAACSAELGDEGFAHIVEELPLDVAGVAMRRIDSSRCAAVLELLPEPRREQVRSILSYGPNTAATLADPLALALPNDITVDEAQRQLRDSEHHLFYHVFVVGRDRTLHGTIAIPELVRARPQQMLRDVMQRDPVSLHAHMDLATVAAHPAWREADALPVVDAARKFIGAIRHRMIRQIAVEPTRPMVDTIVGLSELYWAGLSNILASLTPTAANPEEDANVT
jgi:magnesium transporter